MAVEGEAREARVERFADRAAIDVGPRVGVVVDRLRRRRPDGEDEAEGQTRPEAGQETPHAHSLPPGRTHRLLPRLLVPALVRSRGLRPAGRLQLALALIWAPFWPTRCLLAFLSALQRLLLLISRPFLPPAMSRTNSETGASGTRFEAGPQAAALGGCRSGPTSSMSNWPWRSATRSGSLWLLDAQVDVPAQRLVEQRGDRGRGAVDRVRRAGVGGELDPGADGADVGVVEQLVLRHRRP